MMKVSRNHIAVVLSCLIACAIQIPVYAQEQPAAPVPPVDETKKQVLIEVRIWETSHQDAEQVDFQWTWLNLDDSGAPAGGALLGARATFNPKPNIGLSPLDIDVLKSSYGRLRMQLRALEAEGEAEVKASPVILTADGEQATITTKDKIPVIYSNGSDLTTSTRDAGVNLIVTPVIQGNYVHLDINASVSLITRYVRQADPSNDNRIYEQPVIAERKITTKLKVASGHVIFLGGLLEEVEQETVRRVPILSKFPWMPESTKSAPVFAPFWWVGRLFQNTDKNLLRKELFVEIMPRILEPGEMVFWPTEILPEDQPRVLDYYNMGLKSLLPEESLQETTPQE